MERIKTVGTTLRTHWKKSTFITLAAGYGTKMFIKKQQDDEFMKQCCREALSYGSAPIGVRQPNYHVTVILNPASSGGKGRKLFEQYSAPLLHLAGFKVSVQKTEGREEAKELLTIMESCDAVLVAGGDGTIMEALTGLMKREDSKLYRQKTPIGVIPVGQKNSLAKRLFPFDDQVRQLALSTMAVIKQFKRPIDIIEVENLCDDVEIRGKKLYGAQGLEMGAWREADLRKDNYWFFAGLKHRFTYVFSYLTGHKEIIWDWPLSLSVLKTQKVTQHSEPAPQQPARSGFAGFFSSSKMAPKKGQESVEVVESSWWEEPVVSEVGQIEVNIGTSDYLTLKTFPNQTSFSEFVMEGWNRLTQGSETDLQTVVHEAKQFKVDASATAESPRLMSVDGEEVELTGPIRVSLLTNVLTMFCQEADAVKPKESTQNIPSSRWSTRGVTSSLMPGAQTVKGF